MMNLEPSRVQPYWYQYYVLIIHNFTAGVPEVDIWIEVNGASVKEKGKHESKSVIKWDNFLQQVLTYCLISYLFPSSPSPSSAF